MFIPFIYVVLDEPRLKFDSSSRNIFSLGLFRIL